MSKMEKPLDRLEWCVAFGHKPVDLKKEDITGEDLPLITLTSYKKGTRMEVNLCERCGLVYWGRKEDTS